MSWRSAALQKLLLRSLRPPTNPQRLFNFNSAINPTLFHNPLQQPALSAITPAYYKPLPPSSIPSSFALRAWDRPVLVTSPSHRSHAYHELALRTTYPLPWLPPQLKSLLQRCSLKLPSESQSGLFPHCQCSFLLQVSPRCRYSQKLPLRGLLKDCIRCLQAPML